MRYLILLFSLFSYMLSAQDYDDVAVLMNTNDPESVLIGEYFQAKNSIPDENMIYVEMPLKEQIDSVEYGIIAEEVRAQFGFNANADQINYLVTTKGCPQKMSLVSSGLISTRSFEILMSNLTTTDFFSLQQEYDEPFTYLDQGYRIVSRLESLTLEGTYRLIDRGGLQNIDRNLDVVLDYFKPFNLSDELGVEEIKKYKLIDSNDAFLDLGFSTTLDTMDSYYSSSDEISIFIQIGWSENLVPISLFVEKTKSLGILEMNSSALKSSSEQGISPFHFLEANCHAAMGYVSNYYFTGFRQVDFFNNYLDVDKGLTIGQCVFASMHKETPIVLFGDPKSRVELITSTSNIENLIEKKIYPMPSRDYINIDFEDAKRRTVTIFDSSGKVLLSQLVDGQENRVDISRLPIGFLLLAVQEGDKLDFTKIIRQ